MVNSIQDHMIFTAPENIATRQRNLKSVFLGGSIEMGIAPNWQRHTALQLSTRMTMDVTASMHALEPVSVIKERCNVFNPRRTDWDNSWLQDHSNPQFYQQVNWELNALEQADIILMYLHPGANSPISLLELGLHYKKMIVACPQDFYRKGNIDIVCDRYNIPLFNTLPDAISRIKYLVRRVD